MARKRKIKSERTKLKAKLWKIISETVRREAKGVCFTCGLKKRWKKMQGGHGIPQAACDDTLRYHELNVHCQCYHCNINLGGHGIIYAKKILDRYGKEALDRLYWMYENRQDTWGERRFMEEIRYWTVKLNKVKKTT